jgi:hypothetical protein
LGGRRARGSRWRSAGWRSRRLSWWWPLAHRFLSTRTRAATELRRRGRRDLSCRMAWRVGRRCGAATDVRTLPARWSGNRLPACDRNRARPDGRNVGGTHRHGRSCHRTGVLEGVARHGRHRTRNSSIGQLDLVDVRAAKVHADPDRTHVDVEATYIRCAGAIGGNKRLAGCQRHPAHGSPATERRRSAPTLASDERHQRRSIYRSQPRFARHPTPAPADRCPASVVKRRESPRLVVDPGPTPGRHRFPMPVAIWCPPGGSAPGKPDRAIIGVCLPRAVFVEVLVADHVAGDISR